MIDASHRRSDPGDRSCAHSRHPVFPRWLSCRGLLARRSASAARHTPCGNSVPRAGSVPEVAPRLGESWRLLVTVPSRSGFAGPADPAAVAARVFPGCPILRLSSFAEAKKIDFVPFLPTLDVHVRFLLPRIARRRGPYHLFPVVLVVKLGQPGMPLRLATGHQVVIPLSANLGQILLLGHAPLDHHRHPRLLAGSLVQTFPHLLHRAPVLTIALEDLVGFGKTVAG